MGSISALVTVHRYTGVSASSMVSTITLKQADSTRSSDVLAQSLLDQPCDYPPISSGQGPGNVFSLCGYFRSEFTSSTRS